MGAQQGRLNEAFGKLNDIKNDLEELKKMDPKID